MSPRLFLGAFQISDPGLWLVHLMSYISAQVGVYLFLHSCAQKTCGHFNHLHQIWALRTLLRIVESQRLSPPFFFGSADFLPTYQGNFTPLFVTLPQEASLKRSQGVKNESWGCQGWEDVNWESFQDRFKYDETTRKIEGTKGLERESLFEAGK